MSYKDKLKALSKQRAEEIEQENLETHRIVKLENREKHVQVNVRLPLSLVDRLDREILRRYPVGQRTRKQALTEALENWLAAGNAGSEA